MSNNASETLQLHTRIYIIYKLLIHNEFFFMTDPTILAEIAQISLEYDTFRDPSIVHSDILS